MPLRRRARPLKKAWRLTAAASLIASCTSASSVPVRDFGCAGGTCEGGDSEHSAVVGATDVTEAADVTEVANVLLVAAVAAVLIKMTE